MSHKKVVGCPYGYWGRCSLAAVIPPLHTCQWGASLYVINGGETPQIAHSELHTVSGFSSQTENSKVTELMYNSLCVSLLMCSAGTVTASGIGCKGAVTFEDIHLTWTVAEALFKLYKKETICFCTKHIGGYFNNLSPLKRDVFKKMFLWHIKDFEQLYAVYHLIWRWKSRKIYVEMNYHQIFKCIYKYYMNILYEILIRTGSIKVWWIYSVISSVCNENM